MPKSGTIAAFIATAALASTPANALEGDPYANETTEQRDARMAWWRDAKFGMFIHWGVYSVPAGFYDGKPVKGIGEWIMRRAQIPVARYRQYAAEFNPTKYDPESWARLAKQAGMRYMVITAKHHDGFALFPSEVTDWDVADATPWKKDLIGPLADAARKHGLKFGLYYSQAQDWTHPGGAKSGLKEGEGWDEAHKGDFDTYLETIAAPQVREILTRYQPDVLWWDTPHWMTKQRAEPLARLLALRPGIIHNNRLGGGFPGDTETPEQHIPDAGFPGRDWETCMTMNRTWGYKSDDLNWKSTEVLIRNLVDIASKGGNYLLNVGPTANGEIPQASIDRLRQIGKWMDVNGEAIYGTRATALKPLPWGRCTTKSSGNHTILYLHIFDWPQDGKLQIPGLTNPVKSATLLASGASIEVKPSKRGPVFQLPAHAPDPVSSTLKVTIDGKPDLSQIPVQPDKDGSIRLLPQDAFIPRPGIRIEHQKGKNALTKGSSNLGYWTNPKHSVEWLVESSENQTYTVEIEAAAPREGSVLRLEGAGKLAFPIPKTGKYDSYSTTKVGRLTLKNNKPTRLKLTPVADGWQPVNIRKIILTPAP